MAEGLNWKYVWFFWTGEYFLARRCQCLYGQCAVRVRKHFEQQVGLMVVFGGYFHTMNQSAVINYVLFLFWFRFLEWKNIITAGYLRNITNLAKCNLEKTCCFTTVNFKMYWRKAATQSILPTHTIQTLLFSVHFWYMYQLTEAASVLWHVNLILKF